MDVASTKLNISLNNKMLSYGGLLQLPSQYLHKVKYLNIFKATK